MSNYNRNLDHLCINEVSEYWGDNLSVYQSVAVEILCEQSGDTILEYLKNYKDCIKCINSLEELYAFEKAALSVDDVHVYEGLSLGFKVCDLDILSGVPPLCDNIELNAIAGEDLEMPECLYP